MSNPHRLSREAAVAILQRGEGVNIGGRVYTNPAHLPDEAAWASGDSEAEAAARESIDAQIATLTRQRATLTPIAPADADADADTTGKKGGK